MRYVAQFRFRNDGPANSWDAGRLLSKSGRPGSDSPKFARTRFELGRLLPNSWHSTNTGRSWPGHDRIPPRQDRPQLARNRPGLANVARNRQERPRTGQTWPDVDTREAETDPGPMFQHGREAANFDQNRPRIEHKGSLRSVTDGPVSAALSAQAWPTAWPTPVRKRQSLGQNSTKAGLSRGHISEARAVPCV